MASVESMASVAKEATVPVNSKEGTGPPIDFGDDDNDENENDDGTIKR